MTKETRKTISVLMVNSPCQEAELLISMFINNTPDQIQFKKVIH